MPHCVATFSSVKRANCIPCSSYLVTICAIVVAIVGNWAQQWHCSSQVDLHVLVGVPQITEIPRAPAKHISLLLLLLHTHKHTHTPTYNHTYTCTQLYHTLGDNKRHCLSAATTTTTTSIWRQSDGAADSRWAGSKVTQLRHARQAVR